MGHRSVGPLRGPSQRRHPGEFEQRARVDGGRRAAGADDAAGQPRPRGAQAFRRPDEGPGHRPRREGAVPRVGRATAQRSSTRGRRARSGDRLAHDDRAREPCNQLLPRARPELRDLPRGRDREDRLRRDWRHRQSAAPRDAATVRRAEDAGRSEEPQRSPASMVGRRAVVRVCEEGGDLRAGRRRIQGPEPHPPGPRRTEGRRGDTRRRPEGWREAGRQARGGARELLDGELQPRWPEAAGVEQERLLRHRRGRRDPRSRAAARQRRGQEPTPCRCVVEPGRHVCLHDGERPRAVEPGPRAP